MEEPRGVRIFVILSFLLKTERCRETATARPYRSFSSAVRTGSMKDASGPATPLAPTAEHHSVSQASRCLKAPSMKEIVITLVDLPSSAIHRLTASAPAAATVSSSLTGSIFSTLRRSKWPLRLFFSSCERGMGGGGLSARGCTE